MEPGDRIFIPERPSTVTVSGQVLAPTSFSFDPSFKVKNYIDLAGGYSEDADRNRTLVIYPNGMASRVRNWPNSPNLSPGSMTLSLEEVFELGMNCGQSIDEFVVPHAKILFIIAELIKALHGFVFECCFSGSLFA